MGPTSGTRGAYLTIPSCASQDSPTLCDCKNIKPDTHTTRWVTAIFDSRIPIFTLQMILHTPVTLTPPFYFSLIPLQRSKTHCTLVTRTLQSPPHTILILYYLSPYRPCNSVSIPVNIPYTRTDPLPIFISPTRSSISPRTFEPFS